MKFFEVFEHDLKEKKSYKDSEHADYPSAWTRARMIASRYGDDLNADGMFHAESKGGKIAPPKETVIFSTGQRYGALIREVNTGEARG